MKRLLLFQRFFAAVLLLAVSTLSWADEITVDGIKYDAVKSTKQATVISNSYSGDVVIPSSFMYDDVEYSVTSIGKETFYNCTGLTSVTIPNSVTSIEYQAFRGCSGLTSVTIPGSVITIGEFAFYRCTGLTSVILENGVTNIGHQVFGECTGLTEISIPNSVTSIGAFVFGSCISLASVTIPESVTSIGNAPFFECPGLTSIKVASGNPKYDSRHDCNAIIETSTNTLISGCQNTIIPNGVINIDYDAFCCCSSLTSISIPNSVTNIRAGAFEGCGNLASIIIGSDVTSIGTDAFKECNNLTSVTLESNAIVSATRTASTSLKTIFGEQVKEYIIGNGVNTVGDYAFRSCNNLTSVTIGENVKSIGNYAFNLCSDLTSVILGEGVTNIGNYAFMRCGSLTEATIPNSVTNVGNSAFRYCTALNTLTIGNSVNKIGSYAFANNTELADVTCLAEQIPITSTNAFNSSNPENATLHVPASSIELYKSADQWKNFGTILPIGHTEPYKPFSTAEVYYLYNQEADMYLCPGNSYDTQASVGEAGMDMLFEDAAGEDEIFSIGDTQCAAYAVNTRIYNSATAHYMGMSGDGASAYFDQEPAAWYFVPQEDGTFLLSSNTTGNYLYYDGVHTALSITTDASEKGARWHVLTREDIISRMAAATADEPVNVSSLISYADFSRNGKLRVGVWQGNPSRGGNNSNFCAEKFDCNFNVYQILTDLPNGVYKVKAQAYYREGADQNYNPIPAAELRKNGNEHLYARLYANNQEVPVKSIFDETDRCIYGYQTELGIVPNSISNAATAFLQGLYWNELTVKVSDGTLQLGIKKDEYVFYDWTCFDSFRLYYYGQDRNTGDANGNGEVEIGDVTSVLTLMATPEATGYNNKAADANQNGEIEIGDVTTILTIMAGN